MSNFRSLTVQSGIVTQQKDADNLIVGAGITTATGDLTINASGDVHLAAGKSFIADSGGGSFDFSGASGSFHTTTGAVTVGPGAVTVSGATTFTASGTALTVNNNSVFTGAVYANGGVDRSTAATLAIGTVNANAITIGQSGVTTTVAGDLSVTGSETVVGFTTFTSGVTFDGYVVVGDGTGVDTLSFNSTSGRLGSSTLPDVKWLKEVNHSFYVDASTTSDTNGGALTVKAGDGAATNSNGGALTLDGGAKAGTGVGGAVSLGTTNAGSVAIGHSGVTTTVTGGLTQLTGAVSLTGNAASSFTTTSGALTLDAATAVNVGATNATSVAIGSSGITTTVTGGLTQVSGSVSLHANGASDFTTSAGALTLTSNQAATWSTSSGALTLTSAAAATWSTGAGVLTLNGAGGLHLQTNGANRFDISDTNATVQAGVTLDTTGTGNINLPNNASARFKIEGTSVGATVTAPNLNTLTNGSNADALHTHATAEATSAHNVSLTGWTTTATDGYFVAYASGDLTTSKAIANSTFAAANAIGVTEVSHQITVAGHCQVMFETGETPSAGDVVYLSASVAGRVTNVAPSSVGQFVVRIGTVISSVATDTDQYQIVISPMPPIAL